jgi:hypothetical protein
VRKWEVLEGIIQPGDRINSAWVAQTLGVSGHEASGYIQSELSAIRARRSRTQFVIHRKGRTSNSEWLVGVRAADVRSRTSQCVSDMKRTVERALEPDLARMGLLNPRASLLVEAQVNAMVAGLQAMAVSLNSGP